MCGRVVVAINNLIEYLNRNYLDDETISTELNLELETVKKLRLDNMN